ncbi:hypothetical protein [Bacillus sp. JCM 19034]|uniref:hypothetical protein n=1 Tax=Bacillus sp. JCM 19034 TaxID=1481928 RepID=UPI000783696C|nr:hypothetical protein [Bacillus sp. JCM 19034]
MKLQEAYQIMDVSENVLLEELEDKFMYWIRISKSQENLQIEDPDQYVDMDQITLAYNTIKNDLIGYDPSASTPQTFREKLEHFFYHYKFHTIFGIIITIIVGSLLYSIVEHQIEERRLANLPEPDLEILFLGEYHSEDVSPLEDSLLYDFPDWERTVVKFEYAPTETRNELDMAALQRRQIVFATEKPDMYIIDQNHFDLMIGMDAFQPIIGLSDELIAEIDESRLYYYQGELDDDEYLYGIDISGSAVFDSIDMIAEEKIVTVRFNADNKSNVLSFLERAILELE